MKKQWHHKYPNNYGNQQDVNNRQDAHRLFELLRVVLTAKRLLLASKLHRTRDKCPAKLESKDDQKQDDENLE
jgi:hypothetical protein